MATLSQFSMIIMTRREWILKYHFKDYDKNLDEKQSVNC
jgi:hypothetical protein